MSAAARLFWYGGFFLSGVLTALLGPLLPRLSQAWHLNDSGAGLLFAGQFAASLCGSLLGGTLAALLGAKRVVGAGLLFCAAGLGLAALAPGLPGAGGIVVWGAGLGLVIPLVNVTVAGLHPDRRAETLNRLNFVWGAGAVTSGPMIPIVAQFGWQRLLLGFAAIVFAVAVGVFACACAISPAQPPAPAGTAKPLALIAWTGLFLFLYVGVENALSGWLPTYMTRELGTLTGAAWTQAGFWTALLTGRLIVPVFLRGGHARRVLLAGMLLAAAGIAGLLSLPNAFAAMAGACCAGAGLAGLFPTAVALFTEKAGRLGMRITGVVFSMAAAGGVVLPWLLGFSALRLGSVRWAFAAPCICLAAMFAIVAVVNPWRLAPPARERHRSAGVS